MAVLVLCAMTPPGIESVGGVPVHVVNRVADPLNNLAKPRVIVIDPQVLLAERAEFEPMTLLEAVRQQHGEPEIVVLAAHPDPRDSSMDAYIAECRSQLDRSTRIILADPVRPVLVRVVKEKSDTQEEHATIAWRPSLPTLIEQACAYCQDPSANTPVSEPVVPKRAERFVHLMIGDRGRGLAPRQKRVLVALANQSLRRDPSLIAAAVNNTEGTVRKVFAEIKEKFSVVKDRPQAFCVQLSLDYTDWLRSFGWRQGWNELLTLRQDDPESDFQ